MFQMLHNFSLFFCK